MKDPVFANGIIFPNQGDSRLWKPHGLYLFIYYLFIYFWLCWVFVSVRGLSLVMASGGHSSSRCAGLSLSRPLLLRSTGSRRAGSVVVAHEPSCSAACGIFPDQGSNPCPLHWQADSQPLRHQGSPSWTLDSSLPCALFEISLISTRAVATPAPILIASPLSFSNSLLLGLNFLPIYLCKVVFRKMLGYSGSGLEGIGILKNSTSDTDVHPEVGKEALNC